MLKFYLASSFSLKDKVSEIAEYLKARGHIVMVEWWKYDYKQLDLPDEEWYQDSRVTWISERNFNGVVDADVFVLVADCNRSKKFNGANIELGYALALNKPCYCVGVLERSAMYVPVKQYSSIEEILSRLEP